MAAKVWSQHALAIGKKRELRPIFRALKSERDVALDVRALCELEPRFQFVADLHGIPSLRTSPQGLEGLLMIITEQFLSLKAAAAIWARVRAKLGTCTPNDVLSCSEGDLIGLGLSRTKTRAFHAAAKFDFEFSGLSEDGIAKKLCDIHGVGPWTADIYLLAVLGAADAWPKGDLALRIAVQDLLHLKSRPEISEMIGIAEAWRPHRAVAARLLWSHYRGLKGLQQA
jgi:DNA-3-methyladenine glycosylase II